MNTETVFAATLLIILILLIVFTWVKYPYAKYVVLARSDGESKYIAVENVEIIDNKGVKREIIALEGKSHLTSGFANVTSAKAAAGSTTTGADIVFNGKIMGYVKDSGVAAGADPVIGPVVGFVPGSTASMGYIIFTLGCPSKIGRINIKSPDDNTSRSNLQRVKVYLLDKDKNIIKNAEQVIPISDTIPQTLHHISFV